MTGEGDAPGAPVARPVAVVAVLTALTTVPGLGWRLTLAVNVAAALAPFIGLARNRPPNRWAWYAVTAMLTCFAASGIVTLSLTGARRLADPLVDAGVVLGLGMLARLFLRSRARMGNPHRVRTPVNGMDAAMLAIGIGVGLVQVVATVPSVLGDGRPWQTLLPVVEMITLALLLRLASSRAALVRSDRLIIAGAVGAIVFDIMAERHARHALPPDDPRWALWTLVTGLFAWAALDPSMKVGFTRIQAYGWHSEPARLVGLVPIAMLPVGLYAVPLDGVGRLPTPLYLIASAAIASLGLVRGAVAVNDNEHLAQHDPLTNLANRRGMAEAFDALAAVPVPRRGVLCLIDVDDFKQINDQFGHDVGDRVLQEVAARLTQAVGAGGTVGRPGGDEFVLLLTSFADPAQIVAGAFAEPFLIDGRPRTLQASAGVAEVTPRTGLWQILADADIALYTAKAAGKGVVRTYSADQREQILGRMQLASELQQVLGGDPEPGALQLHYQPLVDLATGRIVGCEALVRWHHPSRGLMPPGSFVELAESHGMARELDIWVLQTALAQIAGWAPLYVSVNLGRASMEDPQLATTVLACLAEAGVPPSRLHLEILEHDELPPEAGAFALVELAAAGVVVSLDDFGTGYTSLEYLRRYPVTQLKLDRSITRGLQEAGASPLLEGIVALAGSLELEVVAEGIETLEQRDRLAALGIAVGQGYALARPLPPPQFAELLRSAAPAAL